MSVKLPELKFEVQKLGSVHRGKFVHKPLTIFCGQNNTGKTWTLYSLYHFYKNISRINDDLGQDINHPSKLEELNEILSLELPDFFNSPHFVNGDARFGLVGKDSLEPALRFADATKLFLMPAERNGLHLFFRELYSRRTALLHHVSRGTIELNDLLRDVIYSRYSQPIADYINWLNTLLEIEDSASRSFHPYAEHLKRTLAEGAYRIDPRTGAVGFRPYRPRGSKERTPTLGLHVTSSTVKSLFGLWFYLEHQAASGNVLMIDEPELHIHPGRQRLIARLLARLVNAGINVVISTHSDYVIREFNSLIMLHQKSGSPLRRRLRFREDEVLDPDMVGAYLFADHSITPFEMTREAGIHATTFDEVITNMNTVNSGIFFGLRGGSEADADD